MASMNYFLMKLERNYGKVNYWFNLSRFNGTSFLGSSKFHGVNPFEYTNSPWCRHLAPLGNCILYNQFSYSLIETMIYCTRHKHSNNYITRSVVFSGSFGFPHQYNWPPRYNWNIVESGVKYHNPHLTILPKRLSCPYKQIAFGLFPELSFFSQF